MKQDAADKIILFHNRITSVLKNNYPHVLFSPPPQNIYIHIGKAEPASIKHVRQCITKDFFLLYFYPVDELIVQESLYQEFAVNEKILLVELSNEDMYLDKLSLTIETLKVREIQYSTAKDLEGQFDQEQKYIKNTIDIALSNVRLTSISSLNRLRCSLLNLPLIIRDYQNRVTCVDADVPAVVCSAGPSLQSQLEMLKKWNDQLIVIAVGHAMPSLLNAGITPDFVVELDPGCFSYTWQHDLRPDSILVTGTNISPGIPLRFDKIAWYQSDTRLFNNLLSDIGISLPKLSFSRTVTVSAIDFAIELGCKNIALIGNDLCLSQEGSVHVGEKSRETDDRMIEIDGNEGKKVITNGDLEGLRTAICLYTRAVADKATIFNCTLGGAVITDTQRCSFCDFCDKFSKTDLDKPTLYNAEEVELQFGQKEIFRDLTDYMLTLENMIDSARKLQRELKNSSFNMNKVQQFQERLRNYSAEESAKQKNKTIFNILDIINSQVDQIINEAPRILPNETDAIAQLDLFLERYRLIQDILDDIKLDTDVANNRAGEASRDPFTFKSFRKYALNFIKNLNPEFAQFLNLPVNQNVERFKIAIRWQYLPFVKYIRDDGSLFCLSSFLSMKEKADEEIKAFVNESGFNPDNNGIIFYAPGNWIHITELARLYPAIDLIIIEPWPELLSAIINHAMFLNHLPQQTLIVGQNPKLKKTKSLIAQTIKQWKSKSKKPILFKHPRIAQLTEIACYDSIDTLINNL